MPMSRRARRLALAGQARSASPAEPALEAHTAAPAAEPSPEAPTAAPAADPALEAEAPTVAENRVIEVRAADTQVRTEVVEPAIAEVPADAAAAAGVPSAVPLETAVATTAPDAPVEPAQAVAPAAAVCSSADAFAQAADAFGFVPVEHAREDSAAEDPGAASTAASAADEPVSDHREGIVLPAADHVAPRRRIRHRIAAAGASIGVMGVAGLIAVSMTLPASAVAAVQRGGSAMTASLVAADAPSKKIDEHEIQAYVAGAEVQDE